MGAAQILWGEIMIHRTAIRFRRCVAVAGAALLAVPLAFTAAAPASAAPAAAAPAPAAAALGTIEGTVTAEGAGPLDAVDVIAFGDGGYEDTRVTTDAAGDYRLDLAPGSYTVEFAPAAGSPWAAELWEDAVKRSDATPIVVSAGSSTTADAALIGGGTLTGRVTCGGEPLGGALVDPILRGYAGGHTVTTAEDGTYRATGLVPGLYEVAFSGSGDCIGEFWDDVALSGEPTRVPVSADGSTDGIDADLELGGSITGSIASAGVRTYGQVSVYEVGAPDLVVASTPVSDDEGYTVPAVPEGDYLVRFDASSGSRDQWYPDAPTRAGAVPLHVESGVATSGIDFTALPGATISGTVGGALPQQPFTLQVTATPVGSPPTADTITSGFIGADGSYSIPYLTPGEYILSVPGLRDDSDTALTEPQWYRNADTEARAVPVSAVDEQTTGGIDFTLRAAGAPAPTLPPRLAALLDRLGLDADDPRIAAACASTTDPSLQRRLERLGVRVSVTQIGQVRAALCS